MTPLIDVVFLLIIFFMVTSEFARDVRAELDLPKLEGEQRDQAEEAGLVININKGGEIILSVSDAPFTLDELADHLRLAFQDMDSTESRVLLRVDSMASTTRLNEVVELLHEVGIGAARMGTEVPRGEK